MKKSILIVGDSISLDYGKYLENIIEENYRCIRKKEVDKAFENLDNVVGANLGDSSKVSRFIENEYLENNKYDVILMNCGLHDIRRDREKKRLKVNEISYAKNLRKIVESAVKISNRIIWINTTIINDSIHNNRDIGYIRYNKDVISYNNISYKIMKENSIEVIDLYNFTHSFGEFIYKDHVHFKDEIAKLQAKFISEYL